MNAQTSITPEWLARIAHEATGADDADATVGRPSRTVMVHFRWRSGARVVRRYTKRAVFGNATKRYPRRLVRLDGITVPDWTVT